MRYFNWKLAIVLVVAGVVFTVAAISLHRWQKSTRAEQALPRGLKAYEQKNWDEAANQFGRYLTVNGQDTTVLVKYAESQMNRRPRSQGNVQQAITAYRNALRLKPDDVGTAQRLTELYLVYGMAAEAESTAQRYLERRDDPTLRRLMGEALWHQRKFDLATAELKTVIEKHPGEILAFESMGLLTDLRPEGASKPAAAWFDEAVAKNPDSALAHAVRASYRLRSNNKEQAMADLTRAMECDLSDTMVRFRVMRELMNAGAWDKVREQLRAMQARRSDGSPALANVGRAGRQDRPQDEMYTVAEEGMKAMGSQMWDFMPVATHLLILSGHLDKVEEYLSQMRSKDLEPAQVAYLEGLLAEKQGRLRDAVAAWDRSVSLGTRIPEEVHMRMASAAVPVGPDPIRHQPASDHAVQASGGGEPAAGGILRAT